MEYVKIQIDTKAMKEIERFAKSRGLELQDGIDRFIALGASRLKSLREYNKKKAEEAGKPPPKPRKRAKEEAPEEVKPKRPRKRAEPEEAQEEGRVKRPKPLKPKKKKAKAEEPEADPMAPILEEA